MKPITLPEEKLNDLAQGACSELTRRYNFQSGVIRGDEIKRFTEHQQINKFLLFQIYQVWNMQMSKLKHPYFDFTQADVQETLNTLRNQLSQHIGIPHQEFPALLKRAIYNNLKLALDPESLFVSFFFVNRDRTPIELFERYTPFFSDFDFVVNSIVKYHKRNQLNFISKDVFKEKMYKVFELYSQKSGSSIEEYRDNIVRKLVGKSSQELIREVEVLEQEKRRQQAEEAQQKLAEERRQREEEARMQEIERKKLEEERRRKEEEERRIEAERRRLKELEEARKREEQAKKFNFFETLPVDEVYFDFDDTQSESSTDTAKRPSNPFVEHSEPQHDFQFPAEEPAAPKEQAETQQPITSEPTPPPVTPVAQTPTPAPVQEPPKPREEPEQKEEQVKPEPVEPPRERPKTIAESFADKASNGNGNSGSRQESTASFLGRFLNNKKEEQPATPKAEANSPVAPKEEKQEAPAIPVAPEPEAPKPEVPRPEPPKEEEPKVKIVDIQQPSDKPQTIGDRLKAQGNKTQLHDSFNGSKKIKLNEIPIHKQYQYVQKVFEGNNVRFRIIVDKVNNAKDKVEVEDILQKFVLNNESIDKGDNVVQEFLTLLRNRF